MGRRHIVRNFLTYALELINELILHLHHKISVKDGTQTRDPLDR